MNSLPLVGQPVSEKENSDFKPAELKLKLHFIIFYARGWFVGVDYKQFFMLILRSSSVQIYSLTRI